MSNSPEVQKAAREVLDELSAMKPEEFKKLLNEKTPIRFPQLDCSFCGKTNLQAEYIITGPSPSNICDSCVDMCAEILVEKRNKVFDTVSMIRES